jgi:hypothetical protein
MFLLTVQHNITLIINIKSSKMMELNVKVVVVVLAINVVVVVIVNPLIL